jgi:hypothetical protein
MAKNYIRRSVWENCGVLLDDEAFISNPEKGKKTFIGMRKLLQKCVNYL